MAPLEMVDCVVVNLRRAEGEMMVTMPPDSLALAEE
jgi:hypothetical protein